MSIYDYDKTAANNNQIQGITITDGVMRTNSVDNCFQALSSDIARLRDDQSSQIDSTGTAGNYAITSNSVITAYAAGQRFHFKANHANTGAATLNIDLIGQRALEKRGGLALAANDIVANQHCIVEYDAARDVFELLNPNGAETVHTHTLADVTDSGALAALDTVSASEIDDDAVTLAKLAPGTADVLRGHDGSGNPSEVTVGQGLALSGGVLTSGAGTYMHVQQRENGNGGTATSGQFRQREINTEVSNTIAGASLSANQITLPVGTYKITGYQIFGSGVQQSQTRLRNITDSTTDALGGNTGQYGSGSGLSTSPINGIVEVTGGPKVFECQYFTNATINGDGLGEDANSGEQNVYADLFIEKVA